MNKTNEQTNEHADERLQKLRKIQLKEIEIIKKFVEICEIENLKYFMLGGTLLGAIRHKGYIPWDDDADFGMPREDYEIFLKVARKHLLGEINLSTFIENNHSKYFAQLINTNEGVRINGVMQNRIDNIWIDIFPLDGMPKDRVHIFIQKIRLLILRKLFILSNFDKEVQLINTKRSWYNRFGVFVCRHVPIQKLFDPSKRWYALDKALKKYPYEKSSYCLNMMGAYKFKEMFDKSIFGNDSFYEFEGMKLRGPSNYDFYLKQLYGDYMTPPPESEWGRHGMEMMEE